jgi:protease-4
MTPTSDPTPSSSHDQAPAWVAELIKTMQPISDLAAMHALGKRRDNNWRAMVRLFTATIVLVMVGVWVLFQSRAWGLQSDPLQRSVAIIPVEGPIAPGLNASAERLVGLIERACKADSVESLLLQINSPGGSPSEAERVMAAVQTCRAKTDSHEPKRVVAMIDGLGASAAYMIAMSTDEIVAGRYSIVGSIGAISRFTDFSELAKRFGVIEHTYRSNILKGGPSALSGVTPEDEQVNTEIVTDLGRQFLGEVVTLRGDRLKADPEQLFSGRVWRADDAMALGLIDGIASLEDLKRDRFKDINLHRYDTKPSIAEQLGLTQAVRQVMAEVSFDAVDYD